MLKIKQILVVIKNLLWNTKTKAFYWFFVKAVLGFAIGFLAQNIHLIVVNPAWLAVIGVVLAQLAQYFGVSLPQAVSAKRAAAKAKKNVV